MRDLQKWLEPHPEYNCMSFALNLEGWKTPYKDELERDYYIEELLYDYSDKGIADKLGESDVEEMLKTNSHLKVIQETEVPSYPDNSEVIAYRVGFLYDESSDSWDTDFHFKVRIKGQWYEKCGAGPVKKCELFPHDRWVGVPFDEESDMAYNGKIFYLIRR